jgi:CRP-like cAMP-binding protein
VLCTLRAVDKGQPVFHAGELGNSIAIVVRGMLQPTCHGAVAAALAPSKADTHWKALSDVKGLLDLANQARGGEGGPNKSPTLAAKAAKAAAKKEGDSTDDAAAGSGQQKAHDGGGGDAAGGVFAALAKRRKADGSDTDSSANSRGNQLGPGTPVGVATMMVGDTGAHVAWHEHDDVAAAEPSLVILVHKGLDLSSFLELLPKSMEDFLQRVARARLLRTFGASLLGPQANSAQAQRRLVSIADKCRLLHARGGEVVVHQGGDVGALHVVVAGSVKAATVKRRKALAPADDDDDDGGGGGGGGGRGGGAAIPVTAADADTSPAAVVQRVSAAAAAVFTPPTKAGGRGMSVVSEDYPTAEETHTLDRIVSAGQSFGEGALLMRGAVCDATYRAAPGGATLLEVPRHLFFQMLAKDRTLLAALHIKLLQQDASLSAILAHPRARAAFAGFVEKVCSDHHALDAYEAMHAYAKLAPAHLDAAARTVGESIIHEFVREPAPRPVQLSAEARSAALSSVPSRSDGAWPPALFHLAERELDELLRLRYMPQFMAHSVFPHVLALLGNYDAESLFPGPAALERAKGDLVKSMEGELTGTLSELDMSA